jgi:hypothetical protein
MNIRTAVIFAARAALCNRKPMGFGFMHRVHIMRTSPKWSLL